MLRAHCLLATALVCGCTANSKLSQELPGSATNHVCEAGNMRACFDDPVIVAGLGQIGSKGEDGWLPEYEGLAAVDVELSRPHFAMADDVGTIYIADKDADAVRQLVLDGTITTIAGDYAAPNGIWVRGDGTLYVLDLGHDRVMRVDPDRSVSELFHVADGISIGRGLWVEKDESVAYVASATQLLEWTPEAGATVLAEGFASLGNLIVDPGGGLVVTDRGAGRVYRVHADGSKTLIAGDGGEGGGGDGAPALETSLPGVRAVWFTPDGGYFLGTHESDRVWYVDATGVIHAFLDGDDLSEVRGLSLNRAGDLIVVDDDAGFVRVLRRKPV